MRDEGIAPTICIYHGNCADGFGAAWAVWKRFGDRVKYIPGIYGQPAPRVAGEDVVIVDFSYSAETIRVMEEEAASLLILDHHKSAQAALSFLPPPFKTWQAHRNESMAAAAIFDMERSGAMIAWDYFHPGVQAPLLLEHIQDRDLWRFRLPGTREIQACVFSHPYDFKQWDWLVNRCEVDQAKLDMVEEGAAIERKHLKDVEELVGVMKRRMLIGGQLVPVANLPYTMASDAGAILAKGEPFAATYYDKDGARVFSLRSAEGGIDVSQIATLYGGGGHRNAAGFVMPLGWEGDHPLVAAAFYAPQQAAGDKS